MATILLVDDNETLRATYSSFLTQMGYTITAVASVADALTYLATTTPDLLLVDMLLPGANGAELLQKYDVLDAHKNVKTIAFSNLDEPIIETRALNLGASLYLNKSRTTPQELLQAIIGVLAK